MNNVDKIAELFPECITEVEEDGRLKRAINFDTLRQLLSGEFMDGHEAYEFNFVGKKHRAAQVIDAEGNRLIANRESRGRFHSDWCAMIYARILIAKNLLASNGVIFISIDDHEFANLKKICDEVFGEKISSVI